MGVPLPAATIAAHTPTGRAQTPPHLDHFSFSLCTWATAHQVQAEHPSVEPWVEDKLNCARPHAMHEPLVVPLSLHSMALQRTGAARSPCFAAIQGPALGAAKPAQSLQPGLCCSCTGAFSDLDWGMWPSSASRH